MRTILKLLTAAAAAFTLISAVIVLFPGCDTETDYGYSVRFVYENSSECDIRVMQVYTSTIVGSVTAGDTLEIIHLAPGETEEFFHEAMGVWPVDLDLNWVLPYDYNGTTPREALYKAVIVYNGTDSVTHETTDLFGHFTPEQNNICDRRAYTLTEPSKYSKVFTYTFK